MCKARGHAEGHTCAVAMMVAFVLGAGVVAAIPARADDSARADDAATPTSTLTTELPPLTILPTTTTAPTTTTTAPASSEDLLWRADYGTNTDSADLTPPWQSEQEPSRDGVVQNRITVVRDGEVPGSDGRPSAAMRAELQPRDVQGRSYNRAEVYARHAVPGSTAPEEWPDPVGSTRWYGFSVFVPGDFEESSHWASVTQWKGYKGGSPPQAIEIARSRFVLGSSVGSRVDLGSLRKGSWTRFEVGIRFATDDTGWIEIWRDGVQVMPRTSRPTMGTQGDGSTDPTYLKQGLYRSKSWTTTNVVFHGPLSLGLTRDAVAPR